VPVSVENIDFYHFFAKKLKIYRNLSKFIEKNTKKVQTANRGKRLGKIAKKVKKTQKNAKKREKIEFIEKN
jgi:hypothetical protein